MMKAMFEVKRSVGAPSAPLLAKSEMLNSGHVQHVRNTKTVLSKTRLDGCRHCATHHGECFLCKLNDNVSIQEQRGTFIIMVGKLPELRLGHLPTHAAAVLSPPDHDAVGPQFDHGYSTGDGSKFRHRSHSLGQGPHLDQVVQNLCLANVVSSATIAVGARSVSSGLDDNVPCCTPKW